MIVIAGGRNMRSPNMSSSSYLTEKINKNFRGLVCRVTDISSLKVRPSRHHV